MSLDQELREMNNNDEDEDDDDVKLPETPKPVEETQNVLPYIDLDAEDLDIEELMRKNKSNYVDSTENLNPDKTPVLNIDYRVSYDDFKIGFIKDFYY